MKVIIGSPVKGFQLKGAVKAHLEAQGREVLDVGCYATERFVKFPSVGQRLAAALQQGRAPLAINISRMLALGMLSCALLLRRRAPAPRD